MIKKKNADKYKIIDDKTRVLSKPNTVYKTATFVCAGFPEELFKNWKVNCQSQFNDIYWAKIYNDHVKAEAYDELISNKVQYIQNNESTAEEPKEKVSNEPIVFGDGE